MNVDMADIWSRNAPSVVHCLLKIFCDFSSVTFVFDSTGWFNDFSLMVLASGCTWHFLRCYYGNKGSFYMNDWLLEPFLMSLTAMNLMSDFDYDLRGTYYIFFYALRWVITYNITSFNCVFLLLSSLCWYLANANVMQLFINLQRTGKSELSWSYAYN